MPDEPLESAIIRQLLQGRQRPVSELQVDAGDDGAVLRDGTVLTKDILVEGVHFDEDISPEDLGWKTVAVNASDIGAMGGTPSWALLGLSLPSEITQDWIEAFSRGLHAALTYWGIHLVGGDTTRSPGPVWISLSLGGHCTRPLRRDQAQPGDQIWVTGTLGCAAQGFVHGGDARYALHHPVPPVALGAALAELHEVHAMMDLSDGLHKDLRTLCIASGVGARIYPQALPAADWLSHGSDRIALQVAFGEDYQLLFTSSPGPSVQLRGVAKSHGIRLSPIGSICADRAVELDGIPWPPSLFDHFAQRQRS